MKKIKLVWLLSTIIGIGMASCVPDSGTNPNDYHNYNEITISGIDSSYFGDPQTPLTITPTITYSMDHGNDSTRYSYLWTMANGQSAPIMLDTTRNWTVDYHKVPVGEHLITYRVTDKNTGVFSSFNFNFSVRTFNFEGWLVLCDINGTPRLDMASRNVQGTPETADSITVINDILNATASPLVLSGQALKVSCFSYKYNNVVLDSSTMKTTKVPVYGIYISTTGNETTRIDPETFGWDNTMDIVYEFLSGASPGPIEQFYPIVNAPNQQVYVYSNGNIYYNYPTQNLGYGFPINRIQSTGATFNAAPYMAIGGTSVGRTHIIYNTDQSTFVALSSSYGYCNAIIDVAGAKFPWNNTNLDMLYMGNYKKGIKGGLGVAIMKDKTTGVPCILTFSCDGVTKPAKAVKTKYAISDANVQDHIVNASQYVVTGNWNTIFYSVGPTLYQYSYGNGVEQVMEHAGSGDITMLKIDNSASTPYSASPPTTAPWLYKDFLLVGTADGTLSSYQVQAKVTDQLLENFSYSGFGSIVDVSYRVR